MKKILLALLLTCACAGVSKARADKYSLQAGDADHISNLSWNPDDTLILTSSGDDNALRLWDVATGRVLWKSDVSFLQDEVEQYSIRISVWTRDQKFIITGSDNGKLQLWEAGTGRLIWNVKGHADTVTALAASPDGKLLVSCSDAKGGKSELKVWDLTAGRMLRDLSAGQKEIKGVRFVDADRFQTGNGLGRVTTWSAADFKAISERVINPCVNPDPRRTSNVYSPDLTLIAPQCANAVVVTNALTGRVVKRIAKEEHRGLPVFSGDGRTLLVPDSSDSTIVDLRANRVKEFDGLDGGVLNQDGTLDAAAPNYRADGVEIFDTRTGRRRAWLVGHPGVIHSLAFSPDGGRFAAGGGDHVVRVWETRTRRLLLQLEGHSDEVKALSFGEGGKTLTSRSEKEFIVWDADAGTKLREVKEEKDIAESWNVYPSPSGRLALVEEHEKPFRLVDAVTGETVREFVYIEQLDNLAFCPDERRFLAKPWWGGWQLWSVEGGGPIREFDVGYSFHNRVAFHPDGRTFITGGGGQNIFMFDLETGETLWSLLPLDREEFEGKKNWEARRVGYVKRKEERARLADAENEPYRNRVYITFDHYGDMTPPGELRIFEKGEPGKSKVAKPADDANAVWLRLYNDSPLPISVPTQSMYPTTCRFEFPTGQKVLGLCDGREISVWFGLEDRDGKQLRYGFDFGSSAILLPQKSALFAVPREVLRDGRAVVFGFTFKKPDGGESVENFGNTVTLKFREPDLPKE
jgi:WD40 repeat protein